MSGATELRIHAPLLRSGELRVPPILGERGESGAQSSRAKARGNGGKSTQPPIFRLPTSGPRLPDFPTPDFPIPDLRLPILDFPIPDLRLPIPDLHCLLADRCLHHNVNNPAVEPAFGKIVAEQQLAFAKPARGWGCSG